MYKMLTKERTVYCDVDDTLILWDCNKYVSTEFEHLDQLDLGDEDTYFPVIVHHKNVEFLKKLKLQGYGVVIWSAAGAAWAEKVVLKLGLENIADMVMAKPEICLDDLLDAKRIIKSVVWIDPETGEFKRNA